MLHGRLPDSDDCVHSHRFDYRFKKIAASVLTAAIFG